MTKISKKICSSLWKVVLIITLLTSSSHLMIGEQTYAASEYELDRAGWLASAYIESSSDNAPANAIDGRYDTRWANEEAQLSTGNQWFQIDLGKVASFHRLTMDSGTDYPRGYTIQISHDEVEWSNVFSTEGSPTMIADFQQQSARYIRIVQTGSAPSNWWSINEIKVYSTEIDESEKVTGVSLDLTEIELIERENYLLTATLTPEHAANKKLLWTTSNEKVAAVDNSGRVIALGEGTAIITVTTDDGGYTANSLVQVSKRTDLPAAPTTKKGIGSSKYLPLDSNIVNEADKRPIDTEKLEQLNVGWAYNWSIDYNFSNEAEAEFEFVPMIWGPGAITDERIHELKQGRLAGKYTQLLGFNEPELVEQSWTSVDDTIALWPRLMETGLRLGSPAVAYPADGNPDPYGIYWLEEFMRKTEELNYPVDFITLHFYQDFTHPKAVEQLRETLVGLYEKYEKPIWITEIGAIVFGASHSEPSEEISNEYMRKVIPMLESLPFIERYAWFVDSCAHEAACQYTNLYDINDQMTSMGEIYRIAEELPVIPPVQTEYAELTEVTGKVYYGDFVWGEWYFNWNEDKARELGNGKLQSGGIDSALSTGQVYTHGDLVMISFDEEQFL